MSDIRTTRFIHEENKSANWISPSDALLLGIYGVAGSLLAQPGTTTRTLANLAAATGIAGYYSQYFSSG